MSSRAKFALIIFWFVFATHAYAFIWSRNLDAFPQWPEQFGIWIGYLTGLQNSEDIESLTVYYMLVMSFVVVLLFSATAFLAWKLTKRFRLQTER